LHKIRDCLKSYGKYVGDYRFYVRADFEEDCVIVITDMPEEKWEMALKKLKFGVYIERFDINSER